MTRGFYRVLRGVQLQRFGRIEFAFGCDVAEEFRAAVAGVEEGGWQPFYWERDGQLVETGKQWAEVCFVPNVVGQLERADDLSDSGYAITEKKMKEVVRWVR